MNKYKRKVTKNSDAGINQTGRHVDYAACNGSLGVSLHGPMIFTSQCSSLDFTHHTSVYICYKVTPKTKSQNDHD